MPLKFKYILFILFRVVELFTMALNQNGTEFERKKLARVWFFFIACAISVDVMNITDHSLVDCLK
jgi:hypothetical protein